MKVYLIRHGQSVANRDRIVQGQYNSPLSELGQRQAENLGEYIPVLDKIYSSPLDRALKTAEISTGTQSSDLILFDDLMEISFGDWEGNPQSEIDFIDKLSEFAHFNSDPFDGDYNIERHSDFIDRTTQIFEHIVKSADENGHKQIGIFCHGGVMRSIIDFHLDLSDQVHYGNTEIALLEFNGSWELTNLTDHIVID